MSKESTLTPLLAAAIPLGLLIGLSLGALGGGGSILTVPALVYVLGQDPRTATTSSLLIVGATSLIALLPHARAGRVRFGQGLLFGALGTAGSLAGTALSATVPPQVLLTAFAALMLLVAVLMLRRSRRTAGGRRADDGAAGAPGAAGTDRAVGAYGATGADWGGFGDPSLVPLATLHPLTCACPRVAKLIATATVVGAMTGFFGVGGGFVLVPALVLALAFPMPVAVGTSLLVIAVNSATALAGRLAGPGPQAAGAHLDWALIAVFTAAAVLGSLAGSRVASRTNPARLARAFAVLLVAVALYTAARSIPALF
ncbi:MAG TPA: sulfite exporter TauE/SafE family protein [Pedococcus sp.]|nr:sulfite exporter TauE/SafE family protein [Pedococcus sp.]